MRSRRLASLAVIAALGGPAPDAVAGDADRSSPPLAVTVATNAVVRSDPANAKKDGGSRVTMAPIVVELESGAPNGIVVGKDALAWHGALERDGVRLVIGA